MDNENSAGKPRTHKGSSRPSGNGKGGYKGGKPASQGRGGSRGFSKQGGKPGFRDGKRAGGKRYGQGSGKPRSDGYRHDDDRRSSGNAGRGAEDRGYRSKPASDRTEGGYKGSYRGGDRNRRPSGKFNGHGKPRDGFKRNRNEGDGFSRKGGKPGFKSRSQFNGKSDNGSEQRKSSGFRGFENTRNPGGTKSLGYRAGQGKPKGQAKRFTKATPARLLSLEVLTYVREQGCYLSEAIDKFVTYSDKPAVERSFARVLATEVVSRKGSLDQLIDSVLDNPQDIQPDVRDALRMSFCELFYLGKPDHVIADQGVELVRSVAPQASGLANFALHRAIELKETFPFGDPSEDVKAAAMQEGFPVWLAERLSADLGSQESLRFMQRSNKPAPLFFMLNLARVDGPKTLSSLVERHVKVVPVSKMVDLPCAIPAFGFAERKAVTDELVSRLLSEGSLVITDVAAQCAAALAMPEQKPERFLEIGAGRGTKTIMLQNVALNRFGEQVTLDTLDMDPQRTREREKHLEEAAIKQDQVFVKDATNLSSLPADSYDAVLVDAPCSGIGTLRRHPDIRWRMNEHDVSSLAEVGSKMLAQAARLVSKGGQLTFATCTVLKEENQNVIDAFLTSDAGKEFTVERTVCADALYREKVTGPIYDSHFVCVLRRSC